MAGPRILVVEHEESCPPHLVGTWLTEAGCTLEVCRPYAGDVLPDLTSYDGVLVLGGEMGADDDHVAWLPPLKAAIRDAVEARTALLGICLGHQLIAVALGGEVSPNPLGQTVGLTDVVWTAAAAADDWVAGHTGDEVAIHWNNDVVTRLPEGAVALAHSPGGEVQVARFGPRAWGIQAHPEVDADVVRQWAVTERDEHVSLGRDPDAVLAAIEGAGAALTADWQPLTARFAALTGEDRT